MTNEEFSIFLSIKLIEAGRITHEKAAEILGIQRSSFSRKLRSGTFSYLEILKLADGLGYKIEWVKKQ